MECQQSDSKKLLKVFDASKRKRSKKKREGVDDTNSLATDDSTNASKVNGRRACSAKTSLQNTTAGPADVTAVTNRDSSPTTSPVDEHRATRSPRRHRRSTRDGISLALKAGLVSTPRSATPSRGEAALESVPQDQDSFIYQFLEEAIKRDKKKQRHHRKHDDRKPSCDRVSSPPREHRQHRRRHREETTPAKERDDNNSRPRETGAGTVIDQKVLLETFAQLCAQMNNNPARFKEAPVSRSISHKSLQCEVISRRDTYDLIPKPTNAHIQRDTSPPSRIRSHDNFQSPSRPRDGCTAPDHRHLANCACCSPQNRRYCNRESKIDVNTRSRIATDVYRYQQDVTPTGSCVETRYQKPEHKEYSDRRDTRYNARRYCEQKASRSFELPRDYEDVRATSRSDPHRKRPEMQRRRYCDRHKDRYYDDKPVKERGYGLGQKARMRRQSEQSDRSSVVSRDGDDRDRLSERERDSGLSGADGETSTMSGKSNYMRVVKQEIAEQRDAMDKMMKLWKELMRCFKGISQSPHGGHEKTVQEAENVRDSAAEQLRLWRECMRRYETVARDVGDTDARLMEEISKQRSEMAEMASMWQECLQRYRDMSNDFNSLKRQLVQPESPQRAPPPLLCAEGEGVQPPPQYRIPPTYPPTSCPMPPMAGAGLRGRASAPPAWWWAEGAEGHEGPLRRRSSPDSRASRDRRHRRKERDDTRYKEKSKPNGARSEHRHRKR